MNGGGWLGVTEGHGVTVSSEQTNPPMTGEGEGGGGVVWWLWRVPGAEGKHVCSPRRSELN